MLLNCGVGEDSWESLRQQGDPPSQSTHVHAQSLTGVQLFLTPMDCSPPGSSVHAIYQARILEWGAISYFRGYSQVRNHTCVSWVSCIGRRILYHWATWKATISQHIHTTVCHHFDNELMRKSSGWITFPKSQEKNPIIVLIDVFMKRTKAVSQKY